MLIRYKPKHDHIKCVPLIATTAGTKNLAIERTQVQLLPGTNEVTDAEWEVMKPHLTREIKNGVISTIEVNAAKSKKTPDGKAHDLKNMPAREALTIVGECVNPDTLAKWHHEETREEIRLAIIERMKELNLEIPKYIPGLGTDSDGDENDGDGEEKELDKMNVDELKAYAAEKGITVTGNKAEILAAIKEAEAQ